MAFVNLKKKHSIGEIIVKKLLERLPNTKYEQGVTEEIVQCNNGCIMSKNMLFIIRIKKRMIIRCPYCNSKKFKTV